MRALVDDVLAGGIEVAIVAEVADRSSILPMVLSGIGCAVILSSWTQTAGRAGAHVQRIVPESYLHVAAVSRRHPPDRTRRRLDGRGPSLRWPDRG